MEIKAFFDTATFTLTFVVSDEKTKDAVVIDSVLNYNPLSSTTSTESLDEVSDYVRQNGLRVHYALETHAHADHLSGAQMLKKRFDAKVGIGEHITAVQEVFKGVFDLGDDFATDGSQFDELIEHGETLAAGSLEVKAIATPGHTPACLTYQIGDALFTGDSLFMHDYGTGRCDFPKGSASELYESIQERLYTLPDGMRVFPGHDYMPNERALQWETTIGKSKAENPHLRPETALEAFVSLRQERDKALDAPRLLFQSVQFNINGGQLPPAGSTGIRYFKLPINMRNPTDDIGDPAE
ncbi:MAG: MBL fold metallo-hydrolase [Polyangiales bacterium]|jgi:glyoxylase-like metal-dependent hydrolase (beta-lactamase superfamily II)